MHIIAGKFKGKKLLGPKDASVRPMTNFAKQAIFSRLEFWDGENRLVGARIADCFCGTGAMGLESLSRGASHVTGVDMSAASLKMAEENARALNVKSNITLIQADMTMVPKAETPFDILFITPPYGQSLAEPSLEALNRRGWIKNASLIMVEVAGHETFTCPDGFEVIDERRYAAAKIIFVCRM